MSRMPPTRRPLPPNWDNWPKEAKMTWLENECTQCEIFRMMLDEIGVELENGDWPVTDMITKEVIAIAFVRVQNEME